MAGKPIGTIYAELDLDKSRYIRSQQALLKDATTTTLNIEDNFRKLHIKSAAEYDLMRAKIVNANSAIAHSAKATADDILRAEKAKNDQLRAINEAQFGKQVSLIDGLKSHWLAASVAIAGAGIVAMKAWELAKQGADFEEQKGILDNLSGKYAKTADSIVESMRRASDGQVANADLMQVALGGIAKGLSPDQLKELAGAAAILGDTVGKSASEALSEITQALESGRVKGLKGYMGATLDLKSAFGELESEMTDAEKVQAMYNLVIMHRLKIEGEQKKAVDGTSDSIARFEADLKNTKAEISRSAAVIASTMLPALSLWSEGVSDLSKRWTAFMHPQASDVLKQQEQGILTQIKALQDIQASPLHDLSGEAEKQLALLYRQLAVVRQTIKNEAAGVYQGKEEKAEDPAIAGYKQKIEELKKVLQAREDDKKSAADLKKIEEQAAKDQIASVQAQMDAWDEENKAYAAIVDERIKEEKKLADEDLKGLIAGTQAQMGAWDEEGKANGERVDADKKASIERLKINRDLYSDIRGYETQAYDASVKLIEDQAQKYRDLGASEVAIARWVAEEKEKAAIKAAQASDSWTAGAKAGFRELEREQLRWGAASASLVKTTSASMGKTFSDVFFDGVQGRWKSLDEYVQDIGDSMLRNFTDSLGRMAAEKITLSFETAWVSGGDNVLGIVDKVLGLAGSAINWVTGYDIGSIGGAYAEGGRPPVGKPILVGEKGPELVFMDRPGYVMNNRESMAYMAKNGGFIPGYEGGGWTDPGNGEDNPWGYLGRNDDGVPIYGNYYSVPEISKLGQPFMVLAPNGQHQYLFTPGVGGNWTRTYVAPMPDRGSGWGPIGGGWAGLDKAASAVGGAIDYTMTEIMGSDLMKNVSEQTPIAAKAILAYLTAYAGTAYLGTMGGSGIGTTAGMGGAGEAGVYGLGTAQAAGAMMAGGAMGGINYAETGSWKSALGTAATTAAITYIAPFIKDAVANAGAEGVSGRVITDLAKRAMAYATKWSINEALGGSLVDPEHGQMKVSYLGANDNGLLASLAESMREIAPREYVVSARNGLDYVPYDGMLIRAHRGERVQTAKEAEQTRRGEAYPPINIRVEVPLILDGRQVALAVAEETLTNQDLVTALRKAVN